MPYLHNKDAEKALRVLRHLYAMLRESHDDDVVRGLALLGQNLRAALEAGDRRQAYAVAAEVAEWLRRNRHLINRRIELSFPKPLGHPAR